MGGKEELWVNVVNFSENCSEPTARAELVLLEKVAVAAPNPS